MASFGSRYVTSPCHANAWPRLQFGSRDLGWKPQACVMSGASTGQADPGSSPVSAGAADLVRRVDCLPTVFPGAMMRGQQLHPSGAAPTSPKVGSSTGGGGGRRRSAHFLAEAFSVQVQFLDKVVAVPAVLGVQRVEVVDVPAAQVSQFSGAGG